MKNIFLVFLVGYLVEKTVSREAVFLIAVAFLENFSSGRCQLLGRLLYI